MPRKRIGRPLAAYMALQTRFLVYETLAVQQHMS